MKINWPWMRKSTHEAYVKGVIEYVAIKELQADMKIANLERLLNEKR